jgi:hypothetical protein
MAQYAKSNDDFKYDWVLGDVGQEFARRAFGDVLPSEGTIRTEVKTDFVAQTSKRIAIEIECKHQGVWQPSGLSTTEADLWQHVIIRNGKPAMMLVFPVSELREMVAGRPLTTCNAAGKNPTRCAFVTLAELFG